MGPVAELKMVLMESGGESLEWDFGISRNRVQDREAQQVEMALARSLLEEV